MSDLFVKVKRELFDQAFERSRSYAEGSVLLMTVPIARPRMPLVAEIRDNGGNESA